MDKLPKAYLGGPEFTELAEKYKSVTYFQIFENGEKITEERSPVFLEVKNGLLYSVNTKPGEDPDAVEKDVQTIYFYELR